MLPDSINSKYCLTILNHFPFRFLRVSNVHIPIWVCIHSFFFFFSNFPQQSFFGWNLEFDSLDHKYLPEFSLWGRKEGEGQQTWYLCLFCHRPLSHTTFYLREQNWGNNQSYKIWCSFLQQLISAAIKWNWFSGRMHEVTPYLLHIIFRPSLHISL